MTDITLTTADDPELLDLRVGETCLVKGKLENIRFGKPEGARKREAAVIITHADWSMTVATLLDTSAAKSIPFKLGTYVTIRCQVINEDAELAAIAIWETSNPVPIIVGEMRACA